MSGFGKLEYSFAKFLAKYPALKVGLKKNYQKINYLINKKKYAYKVLSGISLTSLYTEKENGSFWGYYDKSPFCKNRLLSHSFQKSLSHMVRSDSEISIILDNALISKTTAWNWQQGAMLQWIDDDTIIHNIYADEKYRSKLINIKDSSSRIIDFPIYSYHKATGLTYGLNFKRLSISSPDYGYFCHDADCELDLSEENDGVFKINLETNKNTLIISIKALKEFKFKAAIKGAFHEINHIQIAPNGKRIMFLHRWYDNKRRKFSRLITANPDGSDLYLLSDDNMVSHCTWKNDTEIVGWMNKNHNGYGYFTLTDKSQIFNQLGTELLKEDGHPSFSKCERYMLTDTYPNRSRMSRILLYDTFANKLLVLGEFLSPITYFGENRCDLHPRFSENENFITFDSVHEGIRQQYRLDISKILS